MPGREAAKLGERSPMSLQERFLGLGGEHPVNRLAGETQLHREQVTLRPAGWEVYEQLDEVDFGFRPGAGGSGRLTPHRLGGPLRR